MKQRLYIEETSGSLVVSVIDNVVDIRTKSMQPVFAMTYGEWEALNTAVEACMETWRELSPIVYR